MQTKPNKTVLVTGDEGFVGSHLKPALRKAGFHVIGYDLKSKKDVRNLKQITDIIGKHRPDVVIHLAALAGVRNSMTEYAEYYKTNITGTQNVVRASERSGVRQLIFFSSSSVFQGSIGAMAEDHPKSPISPYGISKLAGELIVQNAKLPAVNIVRPFTIYGTNGRKDMVMHKFMTGIRDEKEITEFFSDKTTTTRGYTSVLDIVDAVIKIMEYGKTDDFNIGGQEIVTISELIGKIEILAGKTARVVAKPLPDGDQPHCLADISKARKLLGYHPSRSFDDTLREIYFRDYANG